MICKLHKILNNDDIKIDTFYIFMKNTSLIACLSKEILPFSLEINILLNNTHLK